MKKQTKKKMTREQKENLKDFFRSLYSNQAAIDGARHNPWWIALIMFLVGVLLPVIPITVSIANSHGSAPFEVNTRSLDTHITDMFSELHEKGIELKVGEDDKLIDVDGRWSANYTYEVSNPQYKRINKNTNQYDLLAYFIEGTVEQVSKSIADNIINKKYVKLSHDIATAETDPKNVYIPNIMVFGYDVFYVSTFMPNSDTPGNAVSGDYKSTKTGTNLVDFVLVGEDKHVATSNKQYEVNEVFTNFKGFLNEGYEANKAQAMLYQTLVSLAVYVCLVIFMGLMLFLLTRGKRNIFHVLSYWTCTKIGMWASVAPGLLSLILGFIWPQYAIIYFIAMYGLRTMWISMRQLKPAQ